MFRRYCIDCGPSYPWFMSDSQVSSISLSAASSSSSRLPQKRFFRQRAHANPFSDHMLDYPMNPESMDWSRLFPQKPADARVAFADIGCGYGGLLVALSTLFPDTYILGLEIRTKVADFVHRRILALRERHANDQQQYKNIALIRANAMKFLPNFFEKGQLTKMFFLFPDPHFKRKKHKARIISPLLLSEYAYLLRPEGMLYTATDVLDLHNWMVKHLDDHPLFERISNSDLADDQIVKCVLEKTEEGQKVARNNGDKYLAVYRRIADH